MKEKIESLIRQAENELKDDFAEAESTEEMRTRQILDIFRNHQISYRHFASTTGYGYDDVGRDTLEKVYADVFHTEAALMRPQRHRSPEPDPVRTDPTGRADFKCHRHAL